MGRKWALPVLYCRAYQGCSIADMGSPAAKGDLEMATASTGGSRPHMRWPVKLPSVATLFRVPPPTQLATLFHLSKKKNGPDKGIDCRLPAATGTSPPTSPRAPISHHATLSLSE